MDLAEIRSSDSWDDAKELFDLFEPCKACGAIKFRFDPEDDVRWSAPGTYREYAPPETDDLGKQRAPAKQLTACECGAFDDPGSMSTSSRIQAIENMADAIEDVDESVELDIEAAVEAAIAARSDPDLTGRDDEVLTGALATAIE